MPARKRERIAPTDDWQHLTLRVDIPGQRSYEAIRLIVLFGEPPIRDVERLREVARERASL